LLRGDLPLSGQNRRIHNFFPFISELGRDFTHSLLDTLASFEGPMTFVPDYETLAASVRRFLQSCSDLGSLATGLSLALLMLLVSQVLLPGATRLHGQSLTPGTRIIKRNVTSKFTGSDGSTSGTADFQGNFTAISALPGQALILFRQPDCSLSLGTGSYLVDSGTYTETGLTANYERTLHTEAGLTTTPDVFAKKCSMSPATGLNSTPFVFVGNTTKGVGVFATIGLGSTGNESLYIAAGTSTFTLTNFAFAAAGVIASADLNGDGNGDLVITNTSVGNAGGAVTVLLGNDDGTFETGVTYPTTGTGTDAVVIDDFNGDGKLDLVAISDTAQQTQQLSVLLGKGDGTFAAAQSFAVPTLAGSATSTPASGLISADFRNSGKKDLVLSNGAEFLGNGDGTFSAAANPAFPYFATGSPVNLASGDLNNDGKLDIALSLGSTVSIYTGKGDGTFTAGTSYATIGSTGYVAIDDLDGDGNQDIYIGLGDGGVYVGDSYDPNLSYALMGHGDGTFAGAPAIQPHPGINTAVNGYTGTNLGDVNGDGYPDLIVPGSSTTYDVLLGSSAGTYDIASTIQVPASITLFGKTITGAAASSYAAVADVNGDGKADLVFVDPSLNPYMANGENASNLLPVYFVALSNGDGTFKAPVAYAFPQVAPAADFDINLMVGGLVAGATTASGHVDLIFSFTDVVGGTNVASPYIAGFVALAGNGDGTFSGTPLLTTTSSSATAPNNALSEQISGLIDLNGDKKSDLLVLTPSFSVANGANTQLQLLLGNGDGTFQPPANVAVTASATPASTYSVLVSDLNKDGKLDLVCLNETNASSQAQMAIALGNGDGTFQAPTLLNLSGGDIIRNSGIAAADFNADGNIDLALLNPGDLSGIYYGNGDGTFTSIPSNGNSYPKDLINVAAGGMSIATDLNKDGKPDILAGATILLNIYGSAPVITPPASSTTTLKASATSITVGTSVTFTAMVAGGSGSSGTPTGTVTFLDGATKLGTGTLSSGAATYATSSLATGSHSITAQYGGDANFGASTSAAVTITVSAVAPSFTFGATPSSLSISAAGSTGTTTLTVTPAGGFAQPVSFTCTGLPSEASCGFAPSTVTPGASPATTVLTISTTAAHAVKSSGNNRSSLGGLAAFASLAMLILTFRPNGKRMQWLVVLLTLGVAAGLLGCGGGSSGSGGGGGGGGTTDPGTPAGTTTVTVTATAGSLSQTVSLSVAVQ
jgi:hypothetical protein